MKVVIIGSGNVADVLAAAIADSSLELVQIFARNTAEGENMARRYGCGYAFRPEDMAVADLYLVSVSDSAISQVTKKLSFGSAVVAHTAGTVDISALSSRIANRAVLYPVQTFTKGRIINLSQVPFLVETTTEKSEECLERLAATLSLDITPMTGRQRAQVHLAAVLACNFTNHLYVQAEKILRRQDISFDIIKPLILETACKAVESPSPRLTQSGPASRNDVHTQSLHRDMLSDDPYLQKLYINLSQSIWETLKKK